ncbi:protein disulfide isomerase-like 1-3 [Citrus sinensis]|nr:protein disulfide isomerase-like 1-3 [Citrus sinensis]
MSTKAHLLALSTTIFLLFIVFRLSPFCVYKIDYDGGYVLCVSVFKKFPPISSRDTVAPLDSYESFKDRKYNLTPTIDEKEDAVNLSDKNFSDVLAKNQHVMVAFYAPWCFWSKKLAPEYEAAATELKGKAVLAKVNAINEIELAKRWGIQGYPTIYFFVNGVHVDIYYHDRKKRVFLEQVFSFSTYLTAQSTIALGFLNSLKGLKGEVLAAASKLHPDVLFFQTTRADVAKMFLIDPEIKRPALVFLEKGLNGLATLLWLFEAVHDSAAKSIFQETARAFKGKLLFVYSQMYPKLKGQISDYFGVTGHTSRVIAVASIRKRKKYILNGELTLSNVKSFALDFLGDKLRNQQSKTALSQIQLQQKSLARLPVPDMMTKEAI